MAAELCSAGVWERAGGGYRILDRDAVGRCQDLARQLSGEAALARARIRARDHARAQLMPQMAQAMVVTPPCAACGAPATRIELLAAGQLPARWEHWPPVVRDSFGRHRGPGQWYLILDGVAAGNGYGNPVQAGEAGRIAWALRPPLRYDQVATAGFCDDAGFCQDCDAPYCLLSGTGTCPKPVRALPCRAWQEPGPALVAEREGGCCGLVPASGVMRRDTAYYQELAGCLYGLLTGLDDRIGSEQARLPRHFTGVGGYGLALEEIAGTLAHAQDAIAITGQERAAMLALAARMNLDGDLVLRALAACPQTGGHERRST